MADDPRNEDDPLAPGERTSILAQPENIPLSPSFERRASMDNLEVSEHGSRRSLSRSVSSRESGLIPPPMVLAPHELTLESKPLNVQFEQLQVVEPPESTRNQRQASLFLNESTRGSRLEAKRERMLSSLAVFDVGTEEYVQRGVWKTSRADLGAFGVGIQLYFELLYWLSCAFGIMSLLSVPLLIVSYYGDFAGLSASALVKLTIANIGSCGKFDALCSAAVDYPTRQLFDSTTITYSLSKVTFAFGILDGVIMLILFLTVVLFARYRIAKVILDQDKRNTTPKDFAIQVNHLPHEIEEHHLYAEKLRAHFEKICPGHTICEVTLARDYDRGINKFMNLGKKRLELAELDLQLLDAETDQQRALYRGRIESLEKNMEAMKLSLKQQRLIKDLDRKVVTAFIIFDSDAGRDVALAAYEWSEQSWLIRSCQSRKLRFEGVSISCRQAPEPSDIYYENLDMPRRMQFFRRVFTFIVTLGLLAVCATLMIYLRQTLQSTNSAVASSQVWVVAPVNTTGGCFQGSELRIFPDAACSDTSYFGSPNLTVFDSSTSSDSSRRLIDGAGISTGDPLALSTATGAWYPQGQCTPTPAPPGLLTATSLASGRRLASQSTLPTCSLSLVWSTLDGVCSTSFWRNPQCVCTSLTASQRSGVLACDASAVDPGVPRGTRSVADWTALICAKQAAFAGIPACSSSAVQLVQVAGPACASVVNLASSRLYCGCVNELKAAPAADLSALASCHTFGAPLGAGAMSGWGNSYFILWDRMQWECNQNQRVYNASSSAFIFSVAVNFATAVPATWSGSSSYLKSFLFGNADLAGFTVSATETGRLTTLKSRILVQVSSASSSAGLAKAQSLATAAASASMVGVSSLSVGALVTTTTVACSGYLCPGLSQCIDGSRVCDNFPDCELVSTFNSSSSSYASIAADEVNCPRNATACTANSGMFQCTDGTCIQDVFWCDGFNDCADGSDETSDTCTVRKTQIGSMQTPSVSQWAGFRFGSAIQPKCVQWSVPAEASYLNALRIFSCDENLVYRSGAITLRDPFNLCRQVGTVKFDFSEVSEYQGSTTKLGTYSVTAPASTTCSKLSDCSGLGSAYRCYSKLSAEQLHGNTTEVGLCLPVRFGVENNATAMLDANTCSSGIPLSIVVARAIYRKYVGSDSLMLQDGTYNCYCAQQVNYNWLTNPLYMFPPYTSSEDKTICQAYLKQLVLSQSLTYSMVGIIAVLNFILNITFRFLANFEHHFSTSDKVKSEMRKLFMATFINTALIMLLVNGYFVGVKDSNVIGFGGGAFSDFTAAWFTVVGASYSLTMIANVVMFIAGKLLGTFASIWFSARRAQSAKTQEKMNEGYVYPKFYLAIGVAQLAMIVCSCVIYSGGIPLLIPVVFIFCVFTYWSDKYQLLRLSRIPPQISADIIIWAVQFITLAILGHCLLTVWLYSDPIIFPSPQVSSTLSFTRLAGQTTTSDYFNIAAGQNPSSMATYKAYIYMRLANILTQASAPVMIVGLVTFIYLFASSIIAITNAIFNILIKFFCCCFRSTRSPDSYGGFTQNTYTQSVGDMIRLRVLYTYDIARNPRYTKAVRAISSVDQVYTLRSQTISRHP